MFEMYDCAATVDVDAAGAILSPSERGVVSVAKAGTGLYNVTIGTNLPVGVGMPMLTSRGTAHVSTIAQTALNVWQVATWAASTGAAVDGAFSLAIYRRPGLVGES